MKRSMLTFLLPAHARARYSDEIEALLRESARPVGDRIDVIKQIARWHGEGLMRNSWTVAAIVLGIASVFALGYAINDLTGGVGELPKHWWSAAPAAGLAFAAMLPVAGRLRRPRKDDLADH